MIVTQPEPQPKPEPEPWGIARVPAGKTVRLTQEDYRRLVEILTVTEPAPGTLQAWLDSLEEVP